MFCRKCGAELQDDEKICPACGSGAAIPAEKEERKENGNKAALAVIAVIALAILAAAVFLVLSLTGVGSPHAALRKAFINTAADLAQKDEYARTLEAILEKDYVSEETRYEFSDFSMRINGEEIALPDYCNPVRFGVKTVADRKNSQIYAALSAGIGAMQDINAEAYVSAAAVLLGAPELYPDYFAVSAEELQEEGAELHLEESLDAKRAKEAMDALGKTLLSWAGGIYADIECEKQEKTILDAGDREISAQQYCLSISGDKLEKHLSLLPEKLEETTVFMDYLESITSQQDAASFIDDLYDIMEEAKEGSDADFYDLAYVYVSDKKVVQIFMPLYNEESGEKCDFTISLFGEENAGDDLRMKLEYKDAADDIRLSAAVTDRADLNLHLYLNGNDILDIRFDGEHQTADGKCVYTVKDGSISMKMEENGYGAALGTSFSCVYTVAEASAFAVPDERSARKLSELSKEDALELILTALSSMLENGCIPEELEEDFETAVSGIPYVLDDMDFDGEEEDFSAYDAEAVIYGESGMPYLLCYEDDMVIEMQPVDGFDFSEEYSSAYSLTYEKTIGEADMIIMDYAITPEEADEYLQWEADFNREYYTDYGYQNVEISDIRSDVINGHQVWWLEYSAQYDEQQKTGGVIAYAEIDGSHACTLDMYSFYGTEALSEELLYDCFRFDVIGD